MAAVDRRAVENAAQLASNCAHTLVNEPSLGAYYVMEHIERSVPEFVECKRRLVESRAALTGASMDATFDRDAVRMAGASKVLFALSEMRAEIARAVPGDSQHQPRATASNTALASLPCDTGFD
jgi:hypothetical protein